MIEMHRAKESDREALKDLEELVFGPSAALAGAYGAEFDPDTCAFLLDEKGLAGLCRFTPGTLDTGEGDAWKVFSLHAFCIRPDVRGRGHGQQLAAYLDFLLQSEGAAGVVAGPIGETVKGFFEKMGWEDGVPAGGPAEGMARWYFRGLGRRYPGSTWRRLDE